MSASENSEYIDTVAESSQAGAKRQQREEEDEHQYSKNGEKRRLARAQPEQIQKRRDQQLDRLAQARQTLYELDPEKLVYDLYRTVRKSIPDDDSLRSLAILPLRTLFIDTVKALQEYHQLVPMPSTSAAIIKFASLPASMRAWLAQVRDPLLFNPTLWPDALTTASEDLASLSDPLASHESACHNAQEEDDEAEDSIALANFYLRLYGSKSVVDMKVHALAFDKAHPNYCVRTAALLEELKSLPEGAIPRRSYAGIAIALEILERKDGDDESKWRMICNWLAIQETECEVYEWKELQTEFPGCKAARRDGSLSALEFILVLATKPTGLNSAHGGYAILQYCPTLLYLEADKAADPYRLRASPDNSDATLARVNSFQADVKLHFQFMQEIFSMLDEHSVGAEMSEDMLDIVSGLAAACQLDKNGYLVDPPLVGKDITQESFSGSVSSCYRGVETGYGPRYERWLRQKAMKTDIPALDSVFDTRIACKYGPYVDLWCIIIRHRRWVIIIVVIFLSRYLLLFRKNGIELPYFSVHSAKVCNIFLEHGMKLCWKEGVSDAEVEAFLQTPSLATLLAVLPGDMQEISRETLESLPSLAQIKKWEDWVMNGWTMNVGRMAKVAIGPRAEDQAAILLTRDPGNAKYVPQSQILVQASDRAVYLKHIIALKYARENPPGGLCDAIDSICDTTGITALIETANTELDQYYGALQSSIRLTNKLEQPAEVNAELSVHFSKVVQQANSDFAKAVGSKFSIERLEWVAKLLQLVRTAREASAVLSESIQICIPKSLAPGSFDHLRFLVEYVEEDGNLVRTASTYQGNHGWTQGYNINTQYRKADIGTVKPLDAVKTFFKPSTKGPAWWYSCSGCGTSFLVVDKGRFKHECPILVAGRKEKGKQAVLAVASSVQYWKVPVSEDVRIKQYQDNVKLKIQTSEAKEKLDSRLTITDSAIDAVLRDPPPFAVFDLFNDFRATEVVKAGFQVYYLDSALEQETVQQIQRIIASGQSIPENIAMFWQTVSSIVVLHPALPSLFKNEADKSKKMRSQIEVGMSRAVPLLDEKSRAAIMKLAKDKNLQYAVPEEADGEDSGFIDLSTLPNTERQESL